MDAFFHMVRNSRITALRELCPTTPDIDLVLRVARDAFETAVDLGDCDLVGDSMKVVGSLLKANKVRLLLGSAGLGSQKC